MLPNLPSLFRDYPGQWFVVATLLPLASFLLLLLTGMVRLLRGDRLPHKGDAYLATGAIGLAFVCSLIGGLQYFSDFNATHHHEAHAGAGGHAHHHHGKGEAEHEAGLTAEQKAEIEAEEQFEHRWAANITWASIHLPANDPDRGTELQLGFHIDHLAVVMFLMVTFIATLIHVFSIGYMADELAPIVEDHQVHTEDGHLHRRGRFGRFFLFLSLFCFSMLNLVLADNLFQVFISWELVGVCSYLLVGFYYERRSASNAANKAFITNRVGDAGFIIGLLILWTYVGSFNFQDIFAQIRAPLRDTHGDTLAMAGKVVRGDPVVQTKNGEKLFLAEGGSEVVLFPRNGGHIHDEWIRPGEDQEVMNSPRASQFGHMPYWLLVVAGLGIFLGCVGKSAQFPLHVWLPDAMEGPTPVSALIHAATMVAAGVYLVGRCFPLFTPESRLVIAYTGGITLFVAATIALVMTDIKKVLAYSTVSQLGYMMLALGVGGWVAGLFHLVTHAFFKALLFLGSGSVIYGCHHEQDMLKMGGLYVKMRTTALTMLAGLLAIAGIPLFSGWYSKDAILAQAYGFAYVHPEHSLLFILPLVTAAITAFYMFRMWLMTFTGKPRDLHVYEHAHESPPVMTVPLIILAFFSIVVAWGWPVWDAEASLLEGHIHHAQPSSVAAEFGAVLEQEKEFELIPTRELTEGLPAVYASQFHHLVGNLALVLVAVAILFASLIYYSGVLNPAEALEQFPGVHRFLMNKWYVDELYSAVLVRPALTVARWCRNFDLRAIDGLINGTGRATVRLAREGGRFDLGVVDGLVNLTARVIYAVGARLRTVQTGYLRSYILFLVLAAVGIFGVLWYFVTQVSAR